MNKSINKRNKYQQTIRNIKISVHLLTFTIFNYTQIGTAITLIQMFVVFGGFCHKLKFKYILNLKYH